MINWQPVIDVIQQIKTFLPVTDPVLVFSIVLFIILFAPVIYTKFRIPDIIGIIIAGIVLGPHGLHILERDSAIVLFGTVGLLYIMFLAGLEIDLIDFKKNRGKSMVFGFFTFIIPMILGTLTGFYLLNFSLISSVLLASMFASHTLLAYPIASRFGIAKNRAVNITVGGTIITDTAALLVLAVIVSMNSGQIGSEFWFRLLISLSAYTFAVFWGIPRAARWFFKNYESEGVSQYIFVLSIVFLSAFLSEVAGIEPIIGAFMAGLALNRLIPHTSPLMNRIDFVGKALFIPFFLISVGMLVDLRVLFKGYEALLVAFAMVVVAMTGKWLAAAISQWIFGYTKTERSLIYGLSNAQAAATLAAVLVGYRIGLLNDNVLNGTIIMILVTCFVSSFVVEKAARQQALVEGNNKSEPAEAAQRILIPISSTATVEQLIDFAIMLKHPLSFEPVYPLVVVKDDDQTADKMKESQKLLEKAQKHAAAGETEAAVITRVDVNVSSGIVRAIKDLMATEVVVDWNASLTNRAFLYGSVLDTLLNRTGKLIFVTRFLQPVNTFKRIIVAMPPKAEYEVGFNNWLLRLLHVAKILGASIRFFSSQNAHLRIRTFIAENRINIEAQYTVFNDWEDFLILGREVQPNDLFVIVSARPSTLSYTYTIDNIPKYLSKHFKSTSFCIIYPDQNLGTGSQIGASSTTSELSLIEENMDRITRVGKSFKQIFTSKPDELSEEERIGKESDR